VSWLALLLIGIGVTDLAFSVRPARWLPESLGAAVTVVLGLLAGLVAPLEVLALLVLAGLVLAWGRTVTWGFSDRGRPWVPLLVLGAALVLLWLLSPAAPTAGGPVQQWLDSGPVAVPDPVTADRLLLLVGVLLVQLSTGNVVVRLVLAATGTLNPARHGASTDPEEQLKGGRLLGPLERVFIVGLGLAGYLTAASIVIAAKGLLRWPELQSKHDQHRIHQLTEYFLVGSFMSWLVALGSLVFLLG
jgi:hypothetical protein